MGRPRLDNERRKQIVVALEACVLAEGLSKTTLSKVAEKAGLPRPLMRHYVGNRDDMIGLLIDRVVARGQDSFDKFQNEMGNFSTEDLIDFLVDILFADEVLGELTDELWPVAVSDDAMLAKLAAVYARACSELSKSMAAEGIGENDQERFDRAYSIVAFCYGNATFAEVSFVPHDPNTVRRLMKAMLR